MPLGVAIAPVERPLATGGGPAQARNPQLGPFGPEVLAPRRAPLDDRDRAVIDDSLDPHLVDRMRRHALLAVVADRCDVETWEGHGGSEDAEFACEPPGPHAQRAPSEDPVLADQRRQRRLEEESQEALLQLLGEPPSLVVGARLRNVRPSKAG